MAATEHAPAAGAAPAEAHARRPRKPRGPRGFALIIIVVVGIALVSIATAVVFTSGGTKILSTKTASYEHAQVIAEAGLERAAAYAKAVVRSERDFDLVLDRPESINCATPGGLNTSEWGVPRYSDGNIISFPAGSSRRFRVVPFNGGAYLTRFDDDADDQAFNFNFGPFTGNHNASGNCNEGPTVPNPPLAPFPGAPNGDNPFRDRNRAVWATVIGIFPGTDPTKAKHQVTLRRYIASNERAPVPVMALRRLNVLGTLEFCSGLGDIAVDDNVTTTANIDATGYLRAAGTVTPPAPGAPASCTPELPSTPPAFGMAPNTGRVDYQYVTGANAPGGTFPPRPAGTATGPVYPAPPTEIMDFDSKCNFLLDGDGNDAGLYFWDAGGTRTPPLPLAPITCDHATVMATSSGAPSPSSDPGTLGSCWVPLAVVDGDGGNPTNDVAEPFDFNEFENCQGNGNVDCTGLAGSDWRPNAARNFGGGNTADISGIGTSFVNRPGDHIFGGAGGVAGWPAVSKPNWQTECDTANPKIGFDWNAISGLSGPGADVRCSNCTAGGEPDAFRWAGDGDPPFPAAPDRDRYKGRWHFDPSGFDARIYPAGVYLVRGQDNFYGGDASEPSPEDNRNDWPTITLVFEGNVTLRTLSGSDGGAVGVGTRVGDHPSVIMKNGGDLTITGDWAFAGGVYADRLTIDGNVDVFGLVRVTDRLDVNVGRRLSVYYDNDLITSPQDTIVATPTRSRTLP